MVNAPLNVMALGTAHGKETESLQFEDLSPHQVQHMRTDSMHLATAPDLNRVPFQHIIVFMVAVHKGQCEGQAFQPIKFLIVPRISKPYAAEVSIVLNSG